MLARVRSAILGFAALTASALAQTPLMQSQFQVSQDTLSYQSTYGVAMDDAGRFVVTWLNYNGVDHTDDCTARLFDPSGAAEGNQFGISASATDQFDGPVAKDASGRFMVVWFENEIVKGRRFQPDEPPLVAGPDQEAVRIRQRDAVDEVEVDAARIDSQRHNPVASFLRRAVADRQRVVIVVDELDSGRQAFAQLRSRLPHNSLNRGIESRDHGIQLRGW